MDVVLIASLSIVGVLCVASVIGWWRERTLRLREKEEFQLIQPLSHSTPIATSSHIDFDDDSRSRRRDLGIDSERNERDIILLPGTSELLVRQDSLPTRQKHNVLHGKEEEARHEVSLGSMNLENGEMEVEKRDESSQVKPSSVNGFSNVTMLDLGAGTTTQTEYLERKDLMTQTDEIKSSMLESEKQENPVSVSDASAQTIVIKPEIRHCGTNTDNVHTMHQGTQCLISKRIAETGSDTLDLISTASISVQTVNDMVEVALPDDEGLAGEEISISEEKQQAIDFSLQPLVQKHVGAILHHLNDTDVEPLSDERTLVIIQSCMESLDLSIRWDKDIDDTDPKKTQMFLKIIDILDHMLTNERRTQLIDFLESVMKEYPSLWKEGKHVMKFVMKSSLMEPIRCFIWACVPRLAVKYSFQIEMGEYINTMIQMRQMSLSDLNAIISEVISMKLIDPSSWKDIGEWILQEDPKIVGQTWALLADVRVQSESKIEGWNDVLSEAHDSMFELVHDKNEGEYAWNWIWDIQMKQKKCGFPRFLSSEKTAKMLLLLNLQWKDSDDYMKIRSMTRCHRNGYFVSIVTLWTQMVELAGKSEEMDDDTAPYACDVDMHLHLVRVLKEIVLNIIEEPLPEFILQTIRLLQDFTIEPQTQLHFELIDCVKLIMVSPLLRLNDSILHACESILREATSKDIGIRLKEEIVECPIDKDRVQDAARSMEKCLHICNRMDIDALQMVLSNVDVLKHIGFVICAYAESEVIGRHVLDLLAYLFQRESTQKPTINLRKAWKYKSHILECLGKVVSHGLGEEKIQVIRSIFHVLLQSMSATDFENYMKFAIIIHDSKEENASMDEIDGFFLHYLNDCDDNIMYCSAIALEYLMILEKDASQTQSDLMSSVFSRFDLITEYEWGAQWERKHNFLSEITSVVAKRVVRNGCTSQRGIDVLLNLMHFCENKGKEKSAILEECGTFPQEERENLIILMRFYEELIVSFLNTMLKCSTLGGGEKNVLPIIANLMGLAWTCWCKRDTQNDVLTEMIHRRFHSDRKETGDMELLVEYTENLLQIIKVQTRYFDHVLSALVFHGFIELWTRDSESMELVMNLLEMRTPLDENPERWSRQCMNSISSGSGKPVLTIAGIVMNIRFVRSLRFHPDVDFSENTVFDSIKKLISDSKSLQQSSALIESIDRRYFKMSIGKTMGGSADHRHRAVDGISDRMDSKLTLFVWKNICDLVSEIIRNDLQPWVHFVQSNGTYPSKESYALGLLPPNDSRMAKLHFINVFLTSASDYVLETMESLQTDDMYILLDFLHQVIRMVLEDSSRGSKENDPRLTRSISIMTTIRQRFVDKQFEPNNFYQYEIQEIIRNDPSLLERLMKGTGIDGDDQILAFLFRRAPFLFDIDAKVFQFHHAFPMKLGDPDVYVVSRDDILASAISEFDKRKRIDFRRPWKVQFKGEEHVLDIRGVRREFLTLLSEKIIETGLFVESPSHDCYPNVSVKDAKAFEFVGKLIAKVLLEEEHLKFRMCAFVCKNFLSLPIKLHDLESIDEVWYRNHIVWMRDHTIEGIVELDFTFEGRELCLNGKQRKVTDANKGEYFEKLLDFRIRQFKSAFTSLRKGFTSIINASSLHAFDESELQMVLSGRDSIDILDWKEHTRYRNGYSPEDATITSFWSVLEDADPEWIAKVLQFITGSGTVPFRGFEGYSPPFTIQRVEDNKRFPSASTCFNILKLPDYGEKDIVKKRLEFVIQEALVGFAFS